MSAPFRDLFFELPRAVFETLKCIGEQAVSRAQPRPSLAYVYKHVYKRADPPSARVHLASDQYICFVFERYGWQAATVQRRPFDRKTDIIVTLTCWHRAIYSIDDAEQAMTSGDADAEIDLLDRVVDRAGTRCACVREHGRR